MPEHDSIETGEKKKKSQNSDVFQLLLSVIVTGGFCLVEGWLVFYYNGGFVFPLIFGILIILMVCLHTINMYQILCRRTERSNGTGDKKAEFLIYKQVKELPEVLNQELTSVKADIDQTQLKVSRLLVKKIDDALGGQIESLSNLIGDISIENEELKEKIENLEKDHKKIFELLGSMAFRNDEINNNMNRLLSEVALAEEAVGASESEELVVEPVFEEVSMEEPIVPEWEEAISSEEVQEEPIKEVVEMSETAFDPNKQLSPEEIAALFENV